MDYGSPLGLRRKHSRALQPEQPATPAEASRTARAKRPEGVILFAVIRTRDVRI